MIYTAATCHSDCNEESIAPHWCMAKASYSSSLLLSEDSESELVHNRVSDGMRVRDVGNDRRSCVESQTDVSNFESPAPYLSLSFSIETSSLFPQSR